MDKLNTLKILLRDNDLDYETKALKGRVMQVSIPYHIYLEEKNYSKVQRDKSYLLRILDALEIDVSEVEDNGKEWVLKIPY